jgi:hypothetical protein
MQIAGSRRWSQIQIGWADWGTAAGLQRDDLGERVSGETAASASSFLMVHFRFKKYITVSKLKDWAFDKFPVSTKIASMDESHVISAQSSAPSIENEWINNKYFIDFSLVAYGRVKFVADNCNNKLYG